MNGCKVVQMRRPEIIHAYTRREAIEDGVLVDVSDVSKEAGIPYPVALTHAVWMKYVEVPPKVEAQDEAGRLWDILWMAKHAIQIMPIDVDTIKVRLAVRNDNTEPKRVELKAIRGPGDKGEPVITIMLPHED